MCSKEFQFGNERLYGVWPLCNQITVEDPAQVWLQVWLYAEDGWIAAAYLGDASWRPDVIVL